MVLIFLDSIRNTPNLQLISKKNEEGTDIGIKNAYNTSKFLVYNRDISLL
jgi:hypothetical protein